MAEAAMELRRPAQLWKKMLTGIFFAVSAILFAVFFLPKKIKSSRQEKKTK